MAEGGNKDYEAGFRMGVSVGRMTNAAIIKACRRRNWRVTAEQIGWKITPFTMDYPQGIWSWTLRKTYKLAIEMLSKRKARR